MPDPNPKLIIDPTGVDAQVSAHINTVLNDRFNQEIAEIDSDVKAHSSHFLKRVIWSEGIILLILLFLSSFISYQQWQQSQQINQLIKQLAPTSQISPSRQPEVVKTPARIDRQVLQ